MEQIYTIPVNEAFEASRDDHSCGCPMCALYNKLENNELDLILGASMMEPDIRIKTNESGFCRTHYDMMVSMQNRLGMALTLESHLAELRKDITENALPLIPARGEKPARRIHALEDSCYICSRIAYNYQRMTETVVLLWDTDEDFPAKLSAQPYFCLPHYRMLLDCAHQRLSKKKQPAFAADLWRVVQPYFDKLQNDVSWFCKKFDYRYDEEPWYDSKDAIERAIRFLRSDLHRPPQKKR
ncbi:MAG: hypothetical protein J6R04_01640 [Clostridia bacterium]|nr:hypothetical protein [Clostridia bacterium]